jgi:hypothetical protein
LLCRYLSAAQSNEELTDSLARQWVWYREVPGYDERAQQLAAVQRQDIVNLLREFTLGSIIAIRNPVERD